MLESADTAPSFLRPAWPVLKLDDEGWSPVARSGPTRVWDARCGIGTTAESLQWLLRTDRLHVPVQAGLDRLAEQVELRFAN